MTCFSDFMWTVAYVAENKEISKTIGLYGSSVCSGLLILPLKSNLLIKKVI